MEQSSDGIKNNQLVALDAKTLNYIGPAYEDIEANKHSKTIKKGTKQATLATYSKTAAKMLNHMEYSG